MSTSPLPVLLPFQLSGKIAPEAEQAIKLLWNAANDHYQAILALNKLKAATSTTTTTAGGVAGESASSSDIGTVNEQSTGSYTLQTTDYGAVIVLDTAATFAVTLASFSVPFYAIISNQCAGVAVLTPESGVINGAGSWTIPPGGFAVVAFDSSNWFAAPVCPINTPPLPSNFITGYNSATGEFYQSEIVIDSGGSITLDSGASFVAEAGASMSLQNLRIFSSNANATAGGLLAGNLYRTGSDPDTVCVVH